VLCSVSVAKTEFTPYTLFTELYNSTGVEMLRIEYDKHPKTNYSTEFPLYFPHVQLHSTQVPPWLSPPACCGLVYLPIITSLLLHSRLTLCHRALSTTTLSLCQMFCYKIHVFILLHTVFALSSHNSQMFQLSRKIAKKTTQLYIQHMQKQSVELHMSSIWTTQFHCSSKAVRSHELTATQR